MYYYDGQQFRMYQSGKNFIYKGGKVTGDPVISGTRLDDTIKEV
jgi:hypothetical protein